MLWKHGRKCIGLTTLGDLKGIAPISSATHGPSCQPFDFFEENSSPLWKAVAVWKPAGTQYSLFPCSTPAESPRMLFTRGDIAYSLCSSLNTYPLLFSNNMLCPTAQFRCLAWVCLSFVCFCLYCLQCLYCLPYDGLTSLLFSHLKVF